jgi:hypothetical protein
MQHLPYLRAIKGHLHTHGRPTDKRPSTAPNRVHHRVPHSISVPSKSSHVPTGFLDAPASATKSCLLTGKRQCYLGPGAPQGIRAYRMPLTGIAPWGTPGHAANRHRPLAPGAWGQRPLGSDCQSARGGCAWRAPPMAGQEKRATAAALRSCAPPPPPSRESCCNSRFALHVPRSYLCGTRRPFTRNGPGMISTPPTSRRSRQSHCVCSV